jgi:predicted RNase H-like HicB family nuclease
VAVLLCATGSTIRVVKVDSKYVVIFEQAGNNRAAYVPDLPGCITTGKTLEETKVNIREAIHGHLRTMREYGDPIPPPTSLVGEVEVSTAA